MPLTKRNAVNRELEFYELDDNLQFVEDKAAEAVAARDAAVLFANVFDSTALGIAGTVNGQYFAVPGTAGVYLNLYKNVAGVATLSAVLDAFVGGTLTGALNYAPPFNINSAASIDIGAATSNIVAILGAAAITSLGTIAYGTVRHLWAAGGGFTLTHNATSLILNGSNIVAQDGEVFTMMSLGGGNWRLVGRHYAGPLARTDIANTFASGQIVGAGSGAVNAIIDGGVAIRAIRYRTAGSDRFVVFVSGTAEGGSSVGSDFGIARYDDAGGYLGQSLTIKRSDGGVFLASATGLSKGDGTLNAVNLYVQGSAVLKQADIFVSADQTITLAGALTLAHGLGVAPRLWSVVYVCQTAELGYSIGDVVSGSGGNAPAMWPDATNLNVRFCSVAVSLQHKTTGVLTAITSANWKARFLALK